MAITKAVVPAAGRGTRLLPATRSQPKEMLPVGRKPTIQHVVEELAAAGLREVLLISGQGKRAIEDHLDWGRRARRASRAVDGSCTSFTPASSPAGAGRRHRHRGTLCGRRAFRGGPRRFRPPLPGRAAAAPAHDGRPRRVPPGRHHRGGNGPREAVSRYGIVAPKEPTDSPFAISDIVEKPRPEEAPSNLSAAGRYILDSAVFGAIRQIEPGIGGELWLTDALRMLLREGGEIVCVPLAAREHRLDIGNFQSYFQAFIELSFHDPEYGEAARAWAQRLLNDEEA